MPRLIECEKYAELTQEKVFVNPLSLGGSSHPIAISKCDATTPLIVGGEKTKSGEFPHMASARPKRGKFLNLNCLILHRQPLGGIRSTDRSNSSAAEV